MVSKYVKHLCVIFTYLNEIVYLLIIFPSNCTLFTAELLISLFVANFAENILPASLSVLDGIFDRNMTRE